MFEIDSPTHVVFIHDGVRPDRQELPRGLTPDEAVAWATAHVPRGAYVFQLFDNNGKLGSPVRYLVNAARVAVTHLHGLPVSLRERATKHFRVCTEDCKEVTVLPNDIIRCGSREGDIIVHAHAASA